MSFDFAFQLWMPFIVTVLTNDTRHTHMNVFHRDSTHEWCTSHTYECLSSWQYSRMMHVTHICDSTHEWSTYEYCYICMIRVYTFECRSTLPFKFECLSSRQYSRMMHVTHIWMSVIVTVFMNDTRHTHMNVFIQIGWHRILRFLVKLSNEPEFCLWDLRSVPRNSMVLMIHPMRILVYLVLNRMSYTESQDSVPPFL